MKSRLRRVVSSSKTLGEYLGNHERLVYDALSHEPLTVDHLLERTQLPVSSVMASLLSLELGRRVRQLAGQRYVRL
jgi:DNA processing protein